jgi:hypothetical protein
MTNPKIDEIQKHTISPLPLWFPTDAFKSIEINFNLKSKPHFKTALQNRTSKPHFKTALQNRTSKPHFKTALQNRTSKTCP